MPITAVPMVAAVSPGDNRLCFMIDLKIKTVSSTSGKTIQPAMEYQAVIVMGWCSSEIQNETRPQNATKNKDAVARKMGMTGGWAVLLGEKRGLNVSPRADMK